MRFQAGFSMNSSLNANPPRSGPISRAARAPCRSGTGSLRQEVARNAAIGIDDECGLKKDRAMGVKTGGTVPEI